MNSTWLRTNDIGREFKFPVKKEDLNDFPAKFQVKEPTERCVDWTIDRRRPHDSNPDLVNLIHVINEGDIDEPGDYYINVYIELLDGRSITTETIRLQVSEPDSDRTRG